MPEEKTAPSSTYRVLGLRYRPKLFKELVGQDLMCKIIRQAFVKKRLGAAFLLTGIRGVGKTTIARLFAKLLNCQKPLIDQNLAEPCGICSSCKALDEGAHTDVMEIDGASYTSVEDMRRVLESCHYAPVQGAFRVFVIDEVHMLSKSAFNALLKTLEEPPAHVKFVFATTEVEKIPLTVISRCLRFDLKRIEKTVIAKHLAFVCDKEGVVFEERALDLLASHAGGSLRDALSMLEHALLLAFETDAEKPLLSSRLMTELLGLHNQANVLQTMVCVLRGEAKEAINLVRAFYADGGDPMMFLEQMMHLVHQFSAFKTGNLRAEEAWDEDLRVQALSLEKHLDMPQLARLWQMLVKGRREMGEATMLQLELEMILIRLAYATQLPSPEKLLKHLGGAQGEGRGVISMPQGALKPRPDQQAAEGEKNSLSMPEKQAAVARTPDVPDVKLAAKTEEAPSPDKDGPKDGQNATKLSEKGLGAVIKTPEDVLKALELAREALLYSHFLNDVDVVHMADKRLELKGAAHLPETFKNKLQAFLKKATGSAWQIGMKEGTVVASLAQKRAIEAEKIRQQMAQKPFMKQAQTHLEDLKVVRVSPKGPQKEGLAKQFYHESNQTHKGTP